MSAFAGEILDAAGVLDEAKEHAWRGFGGPGRRQQLRARLVQHGTIPEQLGASARDVAYIASSRVAASRAAPRQLDFDSPEHTPTLGMGGPGILEDQRIREAGPSPRGAATAHARTRSKGPRFPSPSYPRISSCPSLFCLSAYPPSARRQPALPPILYLASSLPRLLPPGLGSHSTRGDVEAHNLVRDLGLADAPAGEHHLVSPISALPPSTAFESAHVRRQIFSYFPGGRHC
eukprot:3829276-Rhodomonas_salina.1